jgi:hypothetical protein
MNESAESKDEPGFSVLGFRVYKIQIQHFGLPPQPLIIRVIMVFLSLSTPHGPTNETN